MIAESLSRRYTRALFLLARKRDLTDTIYSNLEFFCNAMEKDPHFQYFYFSPRIALIKKKEIINKIFRDNFYREFLNFLFLLLDKKRQTLIFRIKREYKSLLNNYINRSEVSITSAYKLDNEETAYIKSILSKSMNKDIELRETVNPAVLGGLIIRIDNNIIDASLQGRLNRMAKNLLE